MRKILFAVAAAAIVAAIPVSAQQSLTPPGLPAIRPLQEKPVEREQQPSRSEDDDKSVAVAEEGGSLSFGPAPARPAVAEEAPTALTPAAPAAAPAVTTRPVNPNQAMPALNIRPSTPAQQAAPSRPVAAQAAPAARPAPAARTATPPRPRTQAAASEQDEIARLDAEVQQARSRLPAAAPSVGVGGGQIPPPEMTVKPGVPVVFNIAREHLNRIVTPFATPFVKTTSQGTTATVEGRIVYIASNNPAPVSLFIGDEADPVNAVTVTAIPRDIPAVQVTLKVEGYEPTVARPVNSQAAANFELSQPFLQTIRELFRSLALGEIPSGYGMAPVRGAHPLMPDCPMTGLRIRPMQELAGSQMVVLVAKAENIGGMPISFNEEMCASDHVIAVAAWPRRELAPGQATEVFIALRRPTQRPANARPSTLMGN